MKLFKLNSTLLIAGLLLPLSGLSNETSHCQPPQVSEPVYQLINEVNHNDSLTPSTLFATFNNLPQQLAADVYACLNDKKRTALWIALLSDKLDHMELTQQQRAAVEQAIADAYVIEQMDNFAEENFDYLDSQFATFVTLFSKQQMKELFYNI